jgi:hypothetical protein
MGRCLPVPGKAAARRQSDCQLEQGANRAHIGEAKWVWGRGWKLSIGSAKIATSMMDVAIFIALVGLTMPTERNLPCQLVIRHGTPCAKLHLNLSNERSVENACR